ncbi:MAG: LytTR family transcriptional regulator DNA-binding domain-containing protein [Bacteroidales bacterium]|nr:LytTR family transcriptional regulator DNA-binding domain-containing protein [Bacteroidales bacterium]
MMKKIPEFLAKKSTNVNLLVFVFIFSMVFVNVYTPFQYSTWFKSNSDSLNFLYSTSTLLGGMVVLIISRIIMYYVNKKELLSLLSYVLWLAAEILVIVMLYTLINKIVLHDGRDAFVIFQRSLVFVPAILAIPYLVSYLFLGLRSKDAAINQLMEQGKTEVKTPITSLDDTLTFFDSNGKARISLKRNNLLYLGANDNYVNIYYLDNDTVGYTMLRNNLKSLEGTIASNTIVRCHRSYMVNLQNVKMINYEKDGLYITFNTNAVSKIPISKSYAEEVMKRFSDL